MQNSRNDRDRRRRRRRRATAILIYVAIAIGLAWFFESQATTTVIFVRHAEKDLSTGEDASLSEEGRRRVEELTRQLMEADVVAGIDAIYVTPFRRSRETAEPLAAKLGLEMNVYDPDDNDAVLDTILQEHKGRIVLVVAHSDTVPTLIADLGASKKVPPIAEDEYDNIYVVVIPWFGKTKTIRLRFGEPYTGLPGEAQM